jgi:hypothetical protein
MSLTPEQRAEGLALLEAMRAVPIADTPANSAEAITTTEALGAWMWDHLDALLAAPEDTP